MKRPDGFLRLHLIPILISVAITSLCFIAFPLSSVLFSKKTVAVVPEHTTQIPGYYPNFRSAGMTEQKFQKALSDGSTIIFLGSSELTATHLDAIPYNFFNQYCQYPVLCIGHAGNQSLNMLSFLASNRGYFNKTKLVIMVSPSWFVSKAARGTSLESFLEFNSDSFLTALDRDPGVPVTAREYIYQYIAREIDNINSPSAIQKSIAYKYSAERNWISGIVMAPFVLYYDLLINIDSSIRRMFINKEVPDTKTPGADTLHAWHCRTILTEIPWDSIYFNNQKISLMRAANNNFGIDSNYYNQFVRNDQYILLTIPFRFNREYRDFCTLLDFLSTTDCKPLIIIQPLNPFVYENLDEFKPLMDKVANTIDEHHFPCLNLFVSDTAQYARGDLEDVMHLGNPGWYKVDHFVFDNFLSGVSKEPL